MGKVKELRDLTKMSKTARVLRVLKTNGSASNLELNKIGFRYAARIHELRNEGHKIITVREPDGIWRFFYHGHKDDVKNYERQWQGKLGLEEAADVE